MVDVLGINWLAVVYEMYQRRRVIKPPISPFFNHSKTFVLLTCNVHAKPYTQGVVLLGTAAVVGTNGGQTIKRPSTRTGSGITDRTAWPIASPGT